LITGMRTGKTLNQRGERERERDTEHKRRVGASFFLSCCAEIVCAFTPVKLSLRRSDIEALIWWRCNSSSSSKDAAQVGSLPSCGSLCKSYWYVSRLAFSFSPYYLSLLTCLPIFSSWVFLSIWFSSVIQRQ
jgi:hypothetical protein